MDTLYTFLNYYSLLHTEIMNKKFINDIEVQNYMFMSLHKVMIYHNIVS